MKSVRRLRVSVTDAAGRRVMRGPAAGLGAWLARHAPAAARGDVAIAIVSDTDMRRLNRVHRGVDRATDVLSFPPKRGTGAARRPRRRAKADGDIAIARGVAGRQARDAGHAIHTEFRVLALHGLLHLMGYDHDEDRGEMARAEDRLRRRAGLPAGLIGRAASRPARSRRA
jgi:probable rRNA maturation factor